MKKGNIYEGVVKKVDFPNKAYVEVIETDENGNEDKTLTLVKGALPGQTRLRPDRRPFDALCQGTAA